MIAKSIKWIAAATLAGMVMGIIDGLTIVLNAKEMFFTSREMWLTSLYAFALNCGGGTLFGMGLSLVVQGASSIMNTSFFNGRFRKKLFVMVLLAAPLFPLLWVLTDGPQASQIPLRPVVVSVVALLFGAMGSMIILRLSYTTQAKGRLPWGFALAGLTLGILLHLGDLVLLVRLYPVFHGALSVGAALMITAPLCMSWNTPRSKQSIILLCTLSIIGITGGAWAINKVRRTQNPRFVISQKTGSASKLVAVVSKIAPPAPNQILDVEEEAIFDIPPLSPRKTLSLPGASVFLITVDALRYDRITPGGQTGPAPNLNKLAQKSAFFKYAYTPLPHTSYAVSSLLTGKYTGPLFSVPGAPPIHETWPQILHRFRYKTGAFFTKAVFFIDRARFEPYLNNQYGFGYAKIDYKIPADERVAQTIEFLDQYKETGTPVFTWTHFFEPHEPYDKTCTTYGSKEQERYDCEISKVDTALRHLLAYIEHHFPESIIIVTSDHGEEFGEHGGKYHGTTLYDEQIRVPLFMKIPGVNPRVIDAPVNLVDLLGTVLTLLDIPVPARVRSNNLVPYLLGDESSNRPAFSEVHEKKMVVWNNHKLIWDKEADLIRLYDLHADPKETKSEGEVKPELAAKLKSKIQQWEKAHPQAELRPIETQNGIQSWPFPIQRALGGDDSAAPDLIQLIAEDHPAPVRQKAAELVAQMWHPNRHINLPDYTAEEDPIVQTWLMIAAHQKTNTVEVENLTRATDRIAPFSAQWVEVILIRMNKGDDRVVDSVIELVSSPQVSMEKRIEGVKLLGEHRIKRANKGLLEQINNYQLALSVTTALGRIGMKSSYSPLVARLKRERFPERRSQVAQSLVLLGDKRATGPIATELARKIPIPNALSLLVALNGISKRPKIYEDDNMNRSVVVWSGTTQQKISAVQIHRIALLTENENTEESISVLCNGKTIASIDFAGPGQQIAELDACKSNNGSPIALTLETPSGLPKLKAVAAVIQ